MQPNLFLITFDADKASRDRHEETRRQQNIRGISTVYLAVDRALRNLGAFYKPMHQVRLLLTHEKAAVVRASVKRVVGSRPILVTELRAPWAIKHPDPVAERKIAAWLRRQFTKQELAEATGL